MMKWIQGGWFQTRPWPKWVKVQREMLAKYVTPKARQGIDISLPALQPEEADRELKIAKAVYEELCDHGITYRHEPLHTVRGEQVIRSPQEVLEYEKEGTCVDLALTFAGICLHYDVLPIIAVFGNEGKEAHVIACIVNGIKASQYRSQRLREDRILWSNGIYSGIVWPSDDSSTEVAIGEFLPDWIVPIECTGFARSEYLAQEEGRRPENTGRESEGRLRWQQTFDRARQAGMEQFRSMERPFAYALDIVTEQQDRGQARYELPFFWGRVGFRRFAIMTVSIALFVVIAMAGWFKSESDKTKAERIYATVSSMPTARLRDALNYDEMSSGVRRELLARLRRDVALPDWETLPEEEYEDRATTLARSATIMALTGDLSLVTQILRDVKCKQSPDVRTFLSFSLPAAAVPSELIFSRIKAIKSEDTVEASAELYGLLLALGRYDRKSKKSEEWRAVSEVLSDMFCKHPDPGVHACAFWVLKNLLGSMGQKSLTAHTAELRRQGIRRLSKGVDLNRRNWFVDKRTGLTFVYFPPNQEFQMGDPRFEGAFSGYYEQVNEYSPVPRLIKLKRPFAIAMQEYPADPSNVFAPQPMDISWDEALSKCAALNGETPMPNHELKLAATDSQAKELGYRLPSEAEWEFAARGGSSTDTPFGNRIAEKSLRLFTILDNRFPRAWHPPNQYGLFDTSGSLSEWCKEVSYSDNLVYDGDKRMNRGGRVADERILHVSSSVRSKRHREAKAFLGLRLARTVDQNLLDSGDPARR